MIRPRFALAVSSAPRRTVVVQYRTAVAALTDACYRGRVYLTFSGTARFTSLYISHTNTGFKNPMRHAFTDNESA